MVEGMGLRLLINEESDSRSCSIGSKEFARHQDMSDAVVHMLTEVPELDEAVVWVHFANGTLEELAAVPNVVDQPGHKPLTGRSR